MKKLIILFLILILGIVTVSDVDAKRSKKTFLGDLPNGQLFSSNVYENAHEIWIDIPTADTDVVKSVMQISSSTLLAAATTWTSVNSDITQNAYPRNVVAVIVSSAADTADITITGSLVVTGLDSKGIATTDTLTISTNSATGNVAFSTMSSVALTVTACSGGVATELNVSIGTGVKIGLANNIVAVSDIYKITIDRVDSPNASQTINVTYDTIDFTTDPNSSRDYDAWLKHKTRE